MALSPGTRIELYDVTALLGEGGMGRVWRATDTQLNRQVAPTVLPNAFADERDRMARILRQLRVVPTDANRPVFWVSVC